MAHGTSRNHQLKPTELTDPAPAAAGGSALAAAHQLPRAGPVRWRGPEPLALRVGAVRRARLHAAQRQSCPAHANRRCVVQFLV